LHRVVALKLIARNDLNQLDQAILTGELPGKRQEGVFKRELLTMLTPESVEDSDP